MYKAFFECVILEIFYLLISLLIGYILYYLQSLLRQLEKEVFVHIKTVVVSLEYIFVSLYNK